MKLLLSTTLKNLTFTAAGARNAALPTFGNYLLLQELSDLVVFGNLPIQCVFPTGIFNIAQVVLYFAWSTWI